MPKVNDAYFENKKNAILDVAESICKTKPLYKLTMKDVVETSGLSFGAVYASFADIDELLIALVNRLRAKVDFSADTEEILQSQDLPEKKLRNIFQRLIQYCLATIESYGKIHYELGTVLTDEKRREKILQGIHEKEHYDYGLGAALKLIEENLAAGYFRTLFAKESIFLLIVVFFDGLMRDVTLTKCYGAAMPQNVTFEEDDLSEALSSAVLSLITINTEERSL